MNCFVFKISDKGLLKECMEGLKMIRNVKKKHQEKGVSSLQT